MTFPIFRKAKFWLESLRTEIGLRLGEETVAGDGVTLGTGFNDRLLVTGRDGSVDAGKGNDILLLEGQGTTADGGQGADIFVLAPEPARSSGPPVGDECLIFDLDGAGLFPDTAVLRGFSPDSVVADLGDGKVEIADPNGDVRVLDVHLRDGSPVDFATIVDSLVFADDGVTTVGGGTRPLLIIAEDIEAAAELRDVRHLANSGSSATILTDETVAGRLSTGRGDDVVLADLRAATADDSYTFKPGRGDDLISLDLRGSEAGETVIKGLGSRGDHDTLVLRIDADTTAATGKCFVTTEDRRGGTLTLELPDFGPEIEVTDRADGAVIFTDAQTRVSFGCYFCDDDADDLTAVELFDSGRFLLDAELVFL